MAWASGGWRAISSSVISKAMLPLSETCSCAASPQTPKSPTQGVSDYVQAGKQTLCHCDRLRVGVDADGVADGDSLLKESERRAIATADIEDAGPADVVDEVEICFRSTLPQNLVSRASG